MARRAPPPQSPKLVSARACIDAKCNQLAPWMYGISVSGIHTASRGVSLWVTEAQGQYRQWNPQPPLQGTPQYGRWKITLTFDWLAGAGVEFNAPTRHNNIGHFGGGLHSQSLDWYWQVGTSFSSNLVQKVKINNITCIWKNTSWQSK